MAKSYEELAQENFEACGGILKLVELIEEANELLNKMMPLAVLSKERKPTQE